MFSICLVSCKNEKDEDEAGNEIIAEEVISIYSPTENQQYQNGDSLTIHAKFSSSKSLHGYQIHVLNQALDTFYQFHQHWHGHELDVQKKWKIEVDSTTTLNVQVQVVVDHDGNTKTKMVPIQVEK